MCFCPVLLYNDAMLFIILFLFREQINDDDDHRHFRGAIAVIFMLYEIILVTVIIFVNKSLNFATVFVFVDDLTLNHANASSKVEL